jgi:hypothetical protein
VYPAGVSTGRPRNLARSILPSTSMVYALIGTPWSAAL